MRQEKPVFPRYSTTATPARTVPAAKANRRAHLKAVSFPSIAVSACRPGFQQLNSKKKKRNSERKTRTGDQRRRISSRNRWKSSYIIIRNSAPTSSQLLGVEGSAGEEISPATTTSDFSRSLSFAQRSQMIS